MKTFNLSGAVTVSVFTKVDAENLQDAIQIAMERPVEEYKWGDKNQSKKVWVNEEYDGEVFDVHEIDI